MELKNQFERLASAVHPADAEAVAAAQRRLDSLVKPPGSLGVLEVIAARMAGVTGKVNNRICGKAVIIMAADNGVVEEGVASAPQAVTLAQTINFVKGVTGVAVLAKQSQAKLYVVDIGVNAKINHPGVIGRKVRMGTANIAKGPAMTENEALTAILAGAEIARQAIGDGCDLIGVGEMGIGNTTTAAAVLMALCGCSANMAVGRGAGIDDKGFERKKQVIYRALDLNRPDAKNAVDIIAKVGGLDIAGMTGVYLAAAAHRVPVVVDGFISAVSACLAVAIAPHTVDYIFPSHLSEEPGCHIAMERLGLTPMLNMRMRLGEGSGCPLAFSLIEFACAAINDMATFSEAGIDDTYLEQIDKTSFGGHKD